MNIFKTTDLGGLPLLLDDFRWIDNGYREAFKGIMSMYDVAASVAVIISGCVRTEAGGTVSITAGFISIGGEICSVAAQAYPSPVAGQAEYWSIFESINPHGEKVFQNTNINQTYIKRAAKVIVASVVPPGHTELADTYTVYQLIQQNIQLEVWKTLYTVTLPSGAFTNPGTYNVQYKKDSSNFIHFRGIFPYEDPGIGTINILIGTLPVEYRPSVLMKYQLASGFNPSSGEFFSSRLEVGTNGEVRVKSADGPSVLLLEMDGIAPFEGG